MIIYVITNQINNKKYIGLTRQSLEKRWRTHLKDWKYKEGRTKPLYLAMKKYGPENFTIKIIKKCSSEEDLLASEIFYIKEYKTNVPIGYNVRSGGDRGLVLSDELSKELSKIAQRKGEIWKKKGIFKGERNPSSKLTWKTVDCIRRDYRKGELTGIQLSQKYDISSTVIYDIIHGRTWVDKEYAFDSDYHNQWVQKSSQATIRKGDKHPNTSLDWSIVNDLRNLYLTGDYTVKDLHSQFNLPTSTISKIVRLESWYHPEYEKKLKHINNIAHQNIKKGANKRQGENHGKAQVTEKEVKEMRTDFLSGMKVRDITPRYNVTRGYLYKILRNEFWKDEDYAQKLETFKKLV